MSNKFAGDEPNSASGSLTPLKKKHGAIRRRLFASGVLALFAVAGLFVYRRHVTAYPSLPSGRLVPGKVELVTLASDEFPPANVVAFSSDRRRIAVDREVGGRVIVMAADEAPNSAASLRADAHHTFNTPPDVVFSPDGSRLAWRAEIGGHGYSPFAAIVDGKVGAPYFDVRQLTFSPDSKHLAYIAVLQDRTECVVRDGVEGTHYSQIPVCASDQYHDLHFEYGIATPMIHFSADSQHIAYIAIQRFSGATGENPDHQTFFVVDGSATAYNGICGGSGTVNSVAISPDGTRVAHIVDLKMKWYGLYSVPPKAFAVEVNGKLDSPHPYIAPETLQFSTDGKRLLYVASDEPKFGMGPPWYVVDNGIPGKKYNFIDPNSLHLGADGLHTYFTAFIGSEPTNERLWGPSTPTGKRVFVSDGNETQTIGDPVTSADGKHEAHLIYTTGNGLTTVVVDGVTDPSIQEQVRDLQFSPDGQHYAYVPERKTPSDDAQIVIDGIQFNLKVQGSVLSFRYDAGDTIHAYTINSGTRSLTRLELKLVPKS